MPTDAAATLAKLTDLATPYAVRTAVTLGLPEFIAAGTVELPALAEKSGSDVDAVGRLLRYLVAHGLFAEPEPGVFELTEVSRLLVGDGARPVREWLDLAGPGARMDAAYTGLPHSIRTGQPAYEQVHGVAFWDDLARNASLRQFFDEVMSAHSYQTAPLITADYDWSEITRVVDVGGGNGALLAQILLAHPHLRGTVLDSPQTVAAARRRFAEADLTDRADVVAGSFFDPLPTGADVYLVSRVLTDWCDESAVSIMRRCAEAAGSAGRVLIVEVLPEDQETDHQAPYDLQMLALVGGRQRGPADFAELAGRAGLVMASSRRWDGGLMLIEGRRDPTTRN